MHVFLETARLVLRRFTEIDVDYLLQLDNEPEVMHFLTGGTPTPRAIIQTKTLPEFRNPRGRLERFAWQLRSRPENSWGGSLPLQRSGEFGPSLTADALGHPTCDKVAEV